MRALLGVTIAALCLGCGRIGFSTETNRNDSATSPDASVASQCKFRDVAVSNSSACAVNQIGDVYCWGQQVEKIALPGPAVKTAMRVAPNVGCALLEDGRAFCWGDGSLGNGSLDGNPVPQLVAGGRSYADLEFQGQRMCLVESGTNALYCWTSAEPEPTRFTDSTGPVSATRLFSGNRAVCIERPNGVVACLDTETTTTFIDIPELAGVNDVSFNNNGSACAIRNSNGTSGDLSCIGSNTEGQLGTGAFSDQGSTVSSPVLGISRAIDIASGCRHSCAIDENYQLWCWGSNESGELGDGALSASPTPKRVTGVSNATRVAARHGHVCAAANEAIYCWGDNREGQLAQPSSSRVSLQPVQLPPNLRFTDVGLGPRSACAVADNGQVWCWGVGTHGKFSVGDRLSALTPVQVPLVFAATGVEVGEGSACAWNATTSACWGRNEYGQLATSSTTPLRVLTPQSTELAAGIIKVQTKFKHWCSLRATGAVQCWGFGFTSPTTMAIPGAVVDIALDADHGCALSDTRIYCWGDNDVGQLGQGTVSARQDTPVIIPSLAFRAVASGGRFSCGITVGREVLCWGSVPIGSGAPVLTPTVIAMPNGFEPNRILAGNDSLRVIATDGQQYVFGYNLFDGRAGDGRADSAPRLVTETFSDISYAARNTCFIDATSGRVLCSGEARRGLLGVPSLFSQATPTVVPVPCQ